LKPIRSRIASFSVGTQGFFFFPSEISFADKMSNLATSRYGKYQMAPTSAVVEGAGSEKFSSKALFSVVLGVPALLTVAAGLHYSWYFLLLAVLGLPTFAAFQYVTAFYLQPIRKQTGLAGKPIEYYMKMKGSSVQGYKGNSKIPMETFFETYFNGDIDINMDMLELLENRYDWAAFVFTMGQAKFFLSQWVPETLWHSRKQDEDQVRDHYDRGDDFYNWFCKYLRFRI
jgi:hypothetical protein